MEYENKNFNATKIIIFIVIGGALVILSELFIFGGINKLMDQRNKDAFIDVANLRNQHNSYMGDGIEIDPSMIVRPAPRMVKPANDIKLSEAREISITIDEILANQKAFEVASIMPALGVEKADKSEEADKQDGEFMDILSGINIEPATNIIPTVTIPAVVSYDYQEPKGRGMIAIIIDDMGISLRSKLVEVLPAPLTLSYLPYAKNLKERTTRASKSGHEIMVHMPMQPMNTYMDGGPRVLSASLSAAEFIDTLDWGLAQFDGFVGINNHMGSKLTQDKDAMTRLMSYLKNRDDSLFFIDSKTIASSVAASAARDAGIAYNERDVFIDHEINKDFIEGALAKLEDIANNKGYAIAIGHPHKETIAALKKWLPTLKDKGLILVPASRLVKRPIAVDNDLVATGGR